MTGNGERHRRRRNPPQRRGPVPVTRPCSRFAQRHAASAVRRPARGRSYLSTTILFAKHYVAQLNSCSSVRCQAAMCPGKATMMELLPAFECAVASTAEIVKATPADMLDAPTPCTEWDVRALLNHVIGTLWLAEALFGDQAPRYPMAPGSLP